MEQFSAEKIFYDRCDVKLNANMVGLHLQGPLSHEGRLLQWRRMHHRLAAAAAQSSFPLVSFSLSPPHTSFAALSLSAVSFLPVHCSFCRHMCGILSV